MKLDNVTLQMQNILLELKRHWHLNNLMEAEICYWQLHGMLHTLSLLGLYDKEIHGYIEDECEKFMVWLYAHILSDSDHIPISLQK